MPEDSAAMEWDSAAHRRSGSMDPGADTPAWLAQARAALGAGGVFVQLMPGFAVRAVQQVMAEQIAHTLQGTATTLLVEAATGTGKTYAYLVPAVLSGRKVLLSTGTKTLQDQLFERDLPAVCRVLGQQPRVALLKGRNNYLCLYRLESALAMGDGGERRTLETLQRWSRRSVSGDLSQAGMLPEDSVVWSLVTSTADNCLVGDCPQYTDCFVMRARRKAMEAQVVVVNHHLLLADLALREGDQGELLPEAEVVIVDEAHQLPDLAIQFFGLSASTRGVREWLRDVLQEMQRPGSQAWNSLQDGVEKVQDAVQALLQASLQWPERCRWSELPATPEFENAFTELQAALGFLEQALQVVAEHHPGLAQAAKRAGFLRDQWQRWRIDTPETVAWVERYRQHLTLHRSPLDAGHVLLQQREKSKANWVFTSATLAIGADFRHAIQQLGLPSTGPTLQLPSPFDYRRQGCLLLPPAHLPEPNHPEYTPTWLNWLWPLLVEHDGGAFFLFTSHRALRQASDWLRRRLPPLRTLLVQGERSRNALLQDFRATGNAWLLGAYSFWEGVDVRGDALSLVIIDRLPFAMPQDPLLQARVARISAAGGNPFRELQLPQAVLTLKQGVGRLIRDPQDAGILVLCDPRVRQKGYGKYFLDSLPPFFQTEDPEEALAFLQQARRTLAGRSAPAICESGGD